MLGTVRGGIKSSGGRFFYDVGMSVGDTVLAYAAGGGNPYAAGIRAADTYATADVILYMLNFDMWLKKKAP